MFSHKVMPELTDTDAMGHVNHGRLPIWFANARNPILRFFSPELDIKNWPLILASINVNFHQQIYHALEIEVKTWVKKIGNSSFSVLQQAWQNNQCVASGEATMVHFDYGTKKAVPIPENIRENLQQHLLSPDMSLDN